MSEISQVDYVPDILYMLLYSTVPSTGTVYTRVYDPGCFIHILYRALEVDFLGPTVQV